MKEEWLLTLEDVKEAYDKAWQDDFQGWYPKKAKYSFEEYFAQRIIAKAAPLIRAETLREVFEDLDSHYRLGNAKWIDGEHWQALKDKYGVK